MTETTITVQGQHTARYDAEQADVQLNVSFDGPKRADVFAKANVASDALRKKIDRLFDKEIGPIIRWSSDSVNVWGARPWNSDGKQLPIVYHAAIEFTTRFCDFGELATFIEECATSDGITVGNITWSLTEDHTKAVMNEVRADAVADAVAKATSYAKALGLSNVTATAIADQGMLGDQSNFGASGGGMELMSARSFKSADMGGAELSLKPEEIEVSAVVDARFSATR